MFKCILAVLAVPIRACQALRKLWPIKRGNGCHQGDFGGVRIYFKTSLIGIPKNVNDMIWARNLEALDKALEVAGPFDTHVRTILGIGDSPEK